MKRYRVRGVMPRYLAASAVLSHWIGVDMAGSVAPSGHFMATQTTPTPRLGVGAPVIVPRCAALGGHHAVSMLFCRFGGFLGHAPPPPAMLPAMDCTIVTTLTAAGQAWTEGCSAWASSTAKRIGVV